MQSIDSVASIIPFYTASQYSPPRAAPELLKSHGLGMVFRRVLEGWIFWKMKPEPHLPARAEIESQIYVKHNVFSHICGVRARPKQITTMSKHCKNQANVYVSPSITNSKHAQILENNRVVELFDEMPAKQKSYQSAVNYKILQWFCDLLQVPSEHQARSKRVQEMWKNHCKMQSEWLRTRFSHSVQIWVLTCKNHATVTLWIKHEKSEKI